MSVPFDPKIHHPDPGSQKPAEGASSQVAKTAKKVAGTKHNAEGAPAPDAAQPPAAKRPRMEPLPKASASASGSGSSGGLPAVDSSTSGKAVSFLKAPPDVIGLFGDYVPEVFRSSPHRKQGAMILKCLEQMKAARKNAAALASASGSASPVEQAQAQMQQAFRAVVKEHFLPEFQKKAVKNSTAPKDEEAAVNLAMQDLQRQFKEVHSIPGLAELMKSSTTEEQREMLCFLISFCPDLRQLHLPGPQVPDDFLELLAPKKGDCRQATLPNLSTFHVNRGTNLSENFEPLLSEVFEACPFLRAVHIEGSITGNCIEKLPSALKFLGLTSPGETFKCDALKNLKTRKELQTIHLGNFPSSPNFVPLPPLSEILPPQLLQLGVERMNSRRHMRAVAGETSYEADFASLSDTCPALQELHIIRVLDPDFTGEFLITLPLCIKKLAVANCPEIRGGSLASLSRYTQLQALNINTLKTSGASFSTLPISLRVLYAIGCPLEDVAIRNLKEKKNLTELNISNTPIKGLYLNELPPSLRKLSIKGCKNIPEAVITELQAARPKLQIVR